MAKTLEMNPSIGRLGHEVSGMRMVSHDEAEREFAEAVRADGGFYRPFADVVCGGFRYIAKYLPRINHNNA
jgi:hypothetical protein